MAAENAHQRYVFTYIVCLVYTLGLVRYENSTSPTPRFLTVGEQVRYDRHDKANKRFSQILQKRLKIWP